MSFSNPINIPSGSNATMEMTSFTSPISISSPFSSSSGGAAISFATTITSPPTSDDGSNAAAAQQQQQQLKKHKPHKCDICNACFARKVHLQRHALRHQNGKPYCCDRCGKCFSRQDSLVRHHRLLHENMVKEVNKPANNKAMTTGKKTKKTNKRACIRCDSITVKCDGKQPCSRCISNHGGESCCYSQTSFPTTIGQASKYTHTQSARSRQRHDSIATTSSSMITIDDDDSIASTSNTWGQQFPVLSVFQQSQMQQQFIPHPFELPQMDGLLMESSKQPLIDLPNFFSICPPQQQLFQQQPPPPPPSHQMLPMFDWSSLMQEQQEESLPFSGSASNKDLNGTLLSSEEAIIQDSTFPSPSIHALQQHNLHMHDLANARIQTQNGDLSAFAMAIAQNNHQSFDGLLRSLSGYGMRNNNGESLVV